MSKPAKLIAAVVASLLVLPVAPVTAMPSSGANITDLSIGLGSYLGALGSYGSTVYEGMPPVVQKFDWYACDSATTFATTRSNTWETTETDVTAAAITSALTTAGCVLVMADTEGGTETVRFYSGTDISAEPTKPYVTVVHRTVHEYLAYDVQAIANGVRLIEVVSAPTLEKVDGVITATDGDYVVDESLGENWLWGIYYMCDEPVTAGGVVLDTRNEDMLAATALANCSQLFGPWTGWETDFHHETTFDPDAEYTNDYPVDWETPPPLVDIQGKYVVRVNEARVFTTWSSSVRIGADDEVSEPISAQKRFYFDRSNQRLAAKQKAALRAWAKSIKAEAGGAPLTITIKGLTQGKRLNPANKSLGIARAVEVSRLLKTAGVTGKSSLSYGGASRVNGSKGRYALVKISWTSVVDR